MAKQPETKVKFSIFNQEFNQGIREMEKESTKLRKEFRLQSEQMKDTATETEKLESKITYLGQEQDNVRKKIELTAQQLNKAKEYYGENSNEANKLSNRLLDLQISEQKLENSINQTKNEIQRQSQEMDDARTEANKFEDSLKKLGDIADKTGNALTVGVSAPLTAAAGIAGKSAMDIDAASRLLTGILGATSDEAKQLTDDLKTLWYDGVGENPEQLARSMMLVKQNIKDINSGEELQKVTKQMLYLADATESDMSEATRGVNQLMYNFGITSSEALDLFTKGQQEGINFSQEMFDNVAEYAPLFKDMGFAAEEYFTLLANGSQNGAYNLDYINDLMKEFNIRVQDGSDTTADAIGEMSKETQDLFEKFEDGNATTEDLFKKIIPELEDMEDQVKANQIAVDLFGTKAEDMGLETMYALDDMNDAFEDTEGAMEDFAKTQDESFGQEAQRTLRGLLQALEPVGRELLELGRDVTPKIRELSEWFINLDDESKKAFMTLGAGAIAIGPTIKGVGTLSNLLGNASGAGLIARFATLGPAGVSALAVAGIAAVGLGIAGLIKKSNEAKEVNLELADSLTNQANQLENNAEVFDKLSGKAKISNDQLAELNDLNIRISESSNPDEIDELQKRYNDLARESGLSKDELNELFTANKNLIDQAPNVKKSISEHGNAFVENTEKVRDYINTLYEASLVELEAERVKQLEREKELMADLERQQRIRNDLENELQYFLDAQNMTQDEIWDRQEEINDLYYHSNLSQEEKNELMREHGALQDALTGDIVKEIQKRQDKLEEQSKSVKSTQEELDKIRAMDEEMASIILKQVGINEETAKQAIKNGEVKQLLNDQIVALQKQKEELIKSTDPAQRNEESFKESVKAIDEQILGLQDAKENVLDLIGEAENYNEELSEDINKNIYTKTHSDDTYRDLNDPVTKAIYLQTYGAVPLQYADGTSFHPGGPAIVGEEGPELVRQGNKWSLHGFGLIPDLKRGADVLNAEQTRKVMSGLMNLPAYASGVGLGTSQVLTSRLNDMSNSLANQHSIKNNVVVNIEASDVIMDGRVVGSIVWKPVKENIDRDNRIRSDFRG